MQRNLQQVSFGLQETSYEATGLRKQLEREAERAAKREAKAKKKKVTVSSGGLLAVNTKSSGAEYDISLPCTKCDLYNAERRGPAYKECCLNKTLESLDETSNSKVILILTSAPFSDRNILHPDATTFIQQCKDKFFDNTCFGICNAVIKCIPQRDPSKRAIKCCQDRLRNRLMR